MRLAFIATALLVLLATSAFADTIKITGHTDYRNGQGGEFNIKAVDAGGAEILSHLSPAYFVASGTTVGTANGTLMNLGYGGQLGFQTFCIEFNETISLGGTYQVTVSSGAIYGGVAGGIDPDNGGPLPKIDLISVGTAFLYSQFAAGSLAGYTYTNGDSRATSAAKLQKAIWFLEDEISLSSSQVASNTFLQLAFGAFGTPTTGQIGNLAGGAKANNTSYSVQVLNLWSNGYKKQDQLFMVPDGGLTLTLLGLALGGIALLRRTLS